MSSASLKPLAVLRAELELPRYGLEVPDYAVDFIAARARLWRETTPAEQGIGTPGGNIYGFLVHPFINPDHLFNPRPDDNLSLVNRLFQSLIDFPEDKITGVTLVEGADNFLRPFTNQESYMHQLFVRSRSGNDSLSPERFQPATFAASALPGEDGVVLMRRQNQPAFEGVVGSNGLGFAFIEHAGHGYTETANPFPVDTENFCKIHALWDELYGHLCERKGTSFGQPKGLFVAGVEVPVPLFCSLVRFEGRSGIKLKQVRPPADLRQSSVWSEISQQERSDNRSAEVGLKAKNGYFWSYMAHVGEPVRKGRCMAEQNMDFLRIPYEWNEAPDRKALEIRGSHCKKLMGNFLRSTKRSYGDAAASEEVPLFELLLRGRDPAVPLPTRSKAVAEASGGARVYLPHGYTLGSYTGDLAPSSPRTMEELAGWDQIVQGLPAGGFKASDTPSTALDELEEEPYLNRFGEGLCHLEYTEGPLKDRHRSMGDQRWEVVKRNIHWHNNHPFLDIEESQFWQVPGGEFLRPDVLSNQRSFVLRVKDFDWESNPDRAAIVAKTTAFKLPPPHRSFGTADLHEHLERNIDSWVGRETPDGRGWAVIEMIAPFPGGNDPNPRATNDLFAKLATFWTEQFWWRKTDCFEFVRRWAAHERPKVKNESYSYTMIVHFERRDTPEAKAVNPKDEVKKILEGDFPWSRVPT